MEWCIKRKKKYSWCLIFVFNLSLKGTVPLSWRNNAGTLVKLHISFLTFVPPSPPSALPLTVSVCTTLFSLTYFLFLRISYFSFAPFSFAANLWAITINQFLSEKRERWSVALLQGAPMNMQQTSWRVRHLHSKGDCVKEFPKFYQNVN